MMRVEFPRLPPPQLSEGQSLSARLIETLVPLGATLIAGEKAAAKSELHEGVRLGGVPGLEAAGTVLKP